MGSVGIPFGPSLDSQGHPLHIFLDAVPDLKKDTVLEMLAHRVEHLGVWRSDGAPVYAARARVHEADHEVFTFALPVAPSSIYRIKKTLSDDPEAPVVFHWMNTVISLAKTFIDRTYHGRGCCTSKICVPF